MLRIPWICHQCARRLSLIPPKTSPKHLLPRTTSNRPHNLRHASTSSTTTTSTTTNITNSSTPHNVSLALLHRARTLSTEHAAITAHLSTTFSAPLSQRLSALSPIHSALTAYDAATTSLHDLRALLHGPDTDPELRALASDDLPPATAHLAAAAQSLTRALVPPHPLAQSPCLLEIRPGAGGQEAALFAGDLLRMYTALCARLRLPTALLKSDESEGGDGGGGGDQALQEAVLEVRSPGAFDLLRTEAGVHRVQRVPATESKGRTHTSAAAVLVLPSLPESPSAGTEDETDPQSDYYVSAADVRTDVFRSKGAGGQHVNTTDSAVRLTHLPTATVVSCQTQRSQLQNRARAWRILRARLAAQRREVREEEAARVRRGAAGHGRSGRGDKVRTYNWGQARVTDHRSGFSTGRLGDVVEGGEGLEEVMGSVRGWVVEREVEALVEEAEREREDGGSRRKTAAAG